MQTNVIGDFYSAEPPFDRERWEQSISSLFEQQVAVNPTSLAVESKQHSLSYASLNEAANGIAQCIVKVGGTHNEPVILLLGPDAPLVVGILGVLKAGKICVPLGPSQPLETLNRILRDSRARLIITKGTNVQAVRRVCDSRCHVLDIERIPSRPDHDLLNQSFSLRSPAYLLYTSGSTGEPRGVVHTQESLLHLVLGSINALGLLSDDRVALMPSSSFIGATRSILATLLSGASLHPFNVNEEGLGQFADWLVEEEITTYHFVPTFFRYFVASLDDRRTFPRLRLVYLGGEPVRKTDVDSFRTHFARDAVLINGYGTTETGAIRRFVIDRDTIIKGPLVPVGFPVADKEVLILDKAGHLLENGLVGEIAVKSRYLASGYWHQPEATQLAFSGISGGGEQVVYRTGDLGRLAPDGCLEHLGRRDAQVKIRGHRVDLAQVETAVLSVPSVTDVAVVARWDRNAEIRLVAYLASNSARQMTVGNVRDILERILPSYSVPSSFVFLDAIPKTSRGKVDKVALPDPPAGRPNLDEPYMAPRTELERFLVKLWCEVLELEEIGIHDSFFHLGGDSLHAAKLINRVQKPLENSPQYIYMSAVFESPTVAKLADYLKRYYPSVVAGVCQKKGSNDLEAIITKDIPFPGTPVDESGLSRMRQLIASRYPSEYEQVTTKNPTAIFLLCSSRSGSTLLRVMLGGHPLLFAPPELRLLGYNTLAEREATHSREEAVMLEGAIRMVMQISSRSALQARNWMAELAERGTTTTCFFRMIQDVLDKMRLVDKTPSYALHQPILERAEACFRDPIFIHLVRHPLEMVHSSEEIRLNLVSPFRHHVSSAAELAEMLWLISHQNILNFLSSVPAQRHYRVQFEELVRNPEVVMRGLCGFLNLTFDLEMLRPHENQTVKMTDSIHPETKMIGDIKFHEYTSIDPTVADRWKKHDSQYTLSERTWDLAERLGYARS